MASRIAELLGAAVHEIRKRTTRTQDGWQERTGMTQSYVSAVERGKRGWHSVELIADAIERAGGDPMDLIRIAARRLDYSPEQAELMALFDAGDSDDREALLSIARRLIRAPARKSRAVH